MRFLGILQAYKKLKLLPAEVHRQINGILGENQNLLEEFRQFLPLPESDARGQGEDQGDKKQPERLFGLMMAIAEEENLQQSAVVLVGSQYLDTARKRRRADHNEGVGRLPNGKVCLFDHDPKLCSIFYLQST